MFRALALPLRDELSYSTNAPPPNSKQPTMVPTPFSRNNSVIENDLAPAAIIVTPYSTGCCIAKEVMNRGYKLICLWSSGFSDDMKKHVPKSANGLKWDLVLDEQESLELTASVVINEAAQHGMQVVACICGGEAGVDLTDALSERLGLLTNGTAIPNRRDKKVQQELVRDAGLRSVRQACGGEFSQVEPFLRTESYPVILKPLDSAGSDGVKLCKTFEEAKEHFIMLTTTHEKVNGGPCTEVLCQEFLKGKEYVVDHVSRDGIHKTMMVWVYDKRDANGASFVYFGDLSVDSESPEAQMLIPYCRGVLDALGVKNGPSHGEFIITENGPCLVEMNCRAFGGDGIWQPLCRALTGGYNQVDVTADAYFNKEKFLRIPDKPPSPFMASGQQVELVSYVSGTVKSTVGYDVIKRLPSFVCLESDFKVGQRVCPTVDLNTKAGTLVLMNTDKEVLERDLALIRNLESAKVLFQVDQNEAKGILTMRQRSFSIDKNVSAMTRSHQRITSNDTPDAYMAAKHIGAFW